MSQPSTYPCPACGAAANLAGGCPGCGRGPDPAAAEVIRLDGEIPELAGRVEQARRTYLALAGELQQARLRRNELAARVRSAIQPPTAAGPGRAAVGPAAPATAIGPSPAVAPAPGVPGGELTVRPEASTRTVQNLLFILGGLLLGAAAIVFTAVAWATFGVAGRAAILAAVTVLALAAPPVAKHRQLTATAETFAAVGLLLVFLDGYAAWSVNLSGVAGWPGARYAALVATLGATVAAGYGAATRLAAPRFAALLAAQPVPPLLAIDLDPDSLGWALVFAAVAGLDLVAVRLIAGAAAVPVALRVVAWAGYGGALCASAGYALAALAVAEVAGPVVLVGAPLVLAALLLGAAGAVARSAVLQAVGGTALVVAVAAAAIRPIGVLRPAYLLIGSAAVVALLAGVVAVSARLMPERVRVGPRIGGYLAVGVVGQVAAVLALVVAVATLVRSMPPWGAEIAATEIPFDWQLPVAVPLVGGALLALLPRLAREPAGVLVGLLAVLAAPATGWAWQATAVVDLIIAVALLLAITGRAAGKVSTLVAVAAAGVLTGHAVLVSLARPEVAAAVLAAVLLAGLAVAAVAARATEPDPLRTAIGGSALAVGLVAGPAALTVGLFAVGVAPWWQARAALAAAGLLLAAPVAVHRWRPAYLRYAGSAVAVAALVTGLAPDLSGVDEPAAIYASVGLLLTLAALRYVELIGESVGVPPGVSAHDVPDQPSRGLGRGVVLVAGGLLLLRSAVAVLPSAWVVLARPYGWVGEIWAGAPSGTGLAPFGVPDIDRPVAVALLVLTVTAGLAGWGRGTPRAAALVAAPVAAVALPVVLAAAGARWPTVPAVCLALGLAALLAAALAPSTSGRGVAPVGVPLGVLLAAPGLTGALPTKASTLAALGLIVGAAAVVGVAGRTRAARLSGWLVAVAAGVVLAVAASLAADLPLRTAAFAVLAVAAATLALGAALRGRPPVEAAARTAEAAAVEVAAHTSAVVAFLLVAGQFRYAAAICTLWGVAVGIRALRPGEQARRRRLLAAVAAGSELVATWLLLAAERVAVLEAYTLPAAGIALLTGWLALRARPGLSSWVTYGPGLAAALLPTLASALVGGQPWRRLLLGTVALAVVLAGAAWRRQAPVLLGGVTLVAVALNEIVRMWDRLPRWSFLAVGGLVLIGLAMTYERRRRDVARLRVMVGRMT